jgi:hypothetical protein
VIKTHSKTKEGFNEIDHEELVNEIYDIIGKKFPLTIQTSFGQIVKIKFEEQWKENKIENDHTKGYNNKSLTNEEISIIENWVNEKLT